jgi:hypothetical protein
MREMLVDDLKAAGFAVRVYQNGVFAYLKTRDVETMEVIMALGGASTLFRFNRQADPHRWNRQGVMVKW